MLWIAGALAVLGGMQLYFASRRRDDLARYEFENRSSGGAIEFATYDDSKRHERAKRGADGMLKRGGMLVAVAIAIVCFWFAFRVVGG